MACGTVNNIIKAQSAVSDPAGSIGLLMKYLSSDLTYKPSLNGPLVPNTAMLHFTLTNNFSAETLSTFYGSQIATLVMYLQTFAG